MRRIIARILTMLILAALVAPAMGAGTHATPTAATEHSAAADEHHGADADASLLRGVNEGAITALTTLIVFVLLVAVLGKFAWGPIAAGLRAREEKIRGDISQAETARASAEAALKEYEKQLATAEDRVRQLIANATADGEKIATNIRMKAQQESEEIKERSQRDIEATKDAALKEIYTKTADLATSVAEKIIRRSLNAGDQQDLVRQSLEQLQSVNKN